MRQTHTLREPVQAYSVVLSLWGWIKSMLLAGHEIVIEARTATRSTKQNNLMWSCLGDLSEQVKWFGKRLTDEGWKDFITAHLNGQELVPNMDGTGFVALGVGRSTSKMTVAEMTAVIDLAHSFGALQNVKWRPTSLGLGDNPEGRQ